MRIYTKTGDKGETSLYGGKRVSKADQRICAYGSVDELQAVLGCVSASLAADKPEREVLFASIVDSVQSDLFVICSELASPQPNPRKAGATLPEQRISWLESQIDLLEASLPELRAFILQGGSPSAAATHLARSVSRRAEREIVALSHTEGVSSTLLTYVNRLSDLLFVLARSINLDLNIPDRELHSV